MKQFRSRALILLLLYMICTACGRPREQTPGTADTVPGNQTVTGAEESSASDTTRKDGTAERQLEKANPAEPVPAKRDPNDRR